MKKVVEKISYWINDRVNDTDCKGILFGLSGGIDSAVVAALCTKSISKNKILGFS